MDLQLGHPEDMEVGRLLTFAYARNFHHFRLQCDGVQSSVFHNFKWTELTELCIENCPSRNRVDWISVIINNPNVKSLSIGYYGNITNEDYKLMAINWKLEKIKIIDNENDSQLNLDLEGLRVILENCGYLKVLSVALKGKEEDYKELFTEFEEKIKQIDCEFIYNTTEYTLPYFDAWQSIEEDFLFNFP